MDERGRGFIDAYVETLKAVLDLMKLVQRERADLMAAHKRLIALIEVEYPPGEDQ